MCEAVIIAALVGCAGARQVPATAADEHGLGSEPTKYVPADQARSFKPTMAFRAHAARVLKVPLDKVRGGPWDAASARKDEHSRGGAWGITAWSTDDAWTFVFGWVTADGTVITAEQNLGVLFAEAGVWDKPPRLSPGKLAQMLAEDLVWSYGGAALASSPVMDPPRLKLAADGSGELRFFYNEDRGARRYQGPGGGRAASNRTWETVVVFTADRKATHTMREVKAAPKRR